MVSIYEAAQAKFDPRYPAQNEIAAFGARKLRGDIGQLATEETATKFTEEVIRSCREFEIEPGPEGYFRRHLQSNNDSLILTHSPVSEVDSLDPDQSVARVEDPFINKRLLWPRGYRLGNYKFWDTLFVQGGTGVPVIEREVRRGYGRKQNVTKSIYFRGIKAATESEVLAVLDRINVLAYFEDEMRENALQRLLVTPTNRY